MEKVSLSKINVRMHDWKRKELKNGSAVFAQYADVTMPEPPTLLKPYGYRSNTASEGGWDETISIRLSYPSQRNVLKMITVIKTSANRFLVSLVDMQNGASVEKCSGYAEVNAVIDRFVHPAPAPVSSAPAPRVDDEPENYYCDCCSNQVLFAECTTCDDCGHTYCSACGTIWNGCPECNEE